MSSLVRLLTIQGRTVSLYIFVQFGGTDIGYNRSLLNIKRKTDIGCYRNQMGHLENIQLDKMSKGHGIRPGFQFLLFLICMFVNYQSGYKIQMVYMVPASLHQNLTWCCHAILGKNSFPQIFMNINSSSLFPRSLSSLSLLR